MRKFYTLAGFLSLSQEEKELIRQQAHSSQFKISYAEPKHSESFWFGRYCYSYELTFVKR